MSLPSPVPAPVPDAALLLDQLADAVYLLDPITSAVLWGNRAAWEMLGLSRAEVLHQSVLSLQKDVTGMPQWADIAHVIRQHPEGFTFIGRHRHSQGHEVPVEVNTTCFKEGAREYFLSVARDITRRTVMSDGDNRRDEQLRFALNEAADGLWDWDVRSGDLFLSPQWKRMLGYGPDEMPGVVATWRNSLHPEDAPRVLHALQEHLDGRQARYQAEYRLRNRNGQYLWVHDRGKVCARDDQGQALRVVGMVHDITARKLLELRLQELAESDPLSGLVSRRQATQWLEQQIRLSQHGGAPVSVLFVDIDPSERQASAVGGGVDERVAAVTQVLLQTLRRADVVCRWAEATFVVLMPGVGREEALPVAQKMCESLRGQALNGAWADSPLTLSIGVATCPQDADTASRLLATADAALYRAQQAGRNRVLQAAAAP